MGRHNTNTINRHVETFVQLCCQTLQAAMGLAVLPYDGGTYVQAPFEDCTEETYNKLLKDLEEIDLTNIKEVDDETDLAGELACAGGACEIT